MIRFLRDYPIYQLKVTLIDSKPAIWRRVQVKKETTLLDLHDLRWEHEVSIESGLDKKRGVRYPTCIEGPRAGPPEDVGAMPGYEEFLKAIRNKRHPEHKEMVAWAAGRFDPEAFDLEAVNRRLSMLK